MSIKKGDEVKVMRGGERGKVGKVVRVLPRASRLIVEKVNMQIRHIKRGRGQASGIRSQAAPISISNVMLLCPACGQPTRLRTIGQERRCHRCGKGY